MTILGANVQDMSVDQLAGAIVLVLGAVGSLLLVIWQSRCACKCRIGISDKCYIFDCSREPPPPESEEASKKKDDENNDIEEGEAENDDGNDEVIVPSPEPEPELVP
tara:strand:- start:556 stop:876 length:321 start_codon:yes stop_codon:yes gene_type:complete